MKYLRPTLVRVCIICMVGMVSVNVSFGQKVKQPSRPLPGSPTVDLPKFESLEAYLQARGNQTHNLFESAVPAGKIEWNSQATALKAVPISVNKHGGVHTSAFSSTKKISTDKIIRSSNGTVRWMRSPLRAEPRVSLAGKQASPAAYTEVALSVFRANKKVFGIENPDQELLSMSTHQDDLGFVHARFEQQFNEIPVWGRDVYVHFNDNGDVYAVNGMYEPTPRDAAALSNVTPAFSVDRAEEIVVQDLKSRDRWAPIDAETAEILGMKLIESRPIWYPDAQGTLSLAYEVNIHPTAIEWYQYIIDAKTGETLNRIDQHCSFLHDQPLPAAGDISISLKHTHHTADQIAVGNGAANYVDAQGIDLAGNTRNFRALVLDQGGFLLQSDLDNVPPGATASLIPEVGGSVVLDAQNNDLTNDLPLIGIDSDSPSQWSDPSGVSAHVNAELTYAYYKNEHGRNAIDDRNQSMVSLIHATDEGQPMDNAFWNGRIMVFGDGNQVSADWPGSLDVAAHEMTHGVIQHTANLVYQFQSGALNESFADIFGILLDPEDTLIGEDAILPRFGIAFRDLLNPGNPQLLDPQPSSMAEFVTLRADQDNGGVHVNSGIPNRAAALIMQQLGFEAAGAIYYRALTTYLTRSSQFGDARMAVEQSTIDFFGDNSAQLAAVQQAFDTVGIFESSGNDTEEGNDVPEQTGGESLIAFLGESGQLGLADITDPANVSVGFFSGEGAIARINPDIGDFTQLSTPRTGEVIFFINQERKLSFVELATGQVNVFDELFIEEEGDLWNAAISPAGNFVAIVSAYVDDPNMYIFDGNELGVIPLEPESTQDGIQVESITFPGVVNWSPNPAQPRIAFDAFNVQAVEGEDDEEYWNIYEIDFEASRIYELLPPQGSEVNIGNIAYSNTDPDQVAFNIFQPGLNSVALGNFVEGDVFSYDLSTANVTSALAPSFSPDDSEVVFYNPDANQLMFIQRESLTLSSLDFNETVFNPKWFIRGGSGGTQNQAPTAGFVVSTISGTAPLDVQFDASSSSDPDGEPLAYDWDFGNGASGGGQMVTHTFSQGGSFEVVLTVMDSGGLSSQAFIIITVEGPSGVSNETADELPQTVALHQNYPNPFNPTTQIRFDLPAHDHVRVEVMDLLGRSVTTLVDDPMPAGSHEFTFDAAGLPSGTYMVVLRAGNTQQVRQMVLLR